MKATRLILLLAALALIAYLSYRRTHPPLTSQRANTADNVLEIRAIPVNHTLNLGSFMVPPQGHHEVKIVVDDHLMHNTRLAGHFSTSNAPGVEVLLLDEPQYEDFKKNITPSNILYMTKTASSSDIQTAVPRGGTYYLVFVNASESQANVSADVTLRYETVHVDSGADHKK
jgi:hypothetical protein